MITTSNRTLLDLGKVSYADFVYRRVGTYPYDERKEKPKLSINGVLYTWTSLMSRWNKTISEYELISVEQGLLDGYWERDTWIPVFKAQLSNNHSLEFTGKKAYQLWALYRKRIGIKREESEAKPLKKGRPSKDKNQPQLTLDFL